MVKLDVPAIVKVPVSVIAPPEVTLKFPAVVTSTPKSTPPVPAFIVKLPSPDEAPVSKLTPLEALVAFNVNGVVMVVKAPTLISPLVLSPMIRLPAVNFPRSVEDKLKPQVPPQVDDPKPIVTPEEARIVVEAVPLLIDVPLRVIPPNLIDKELLPALKVFPESNVKEPVPSESESELKLVVPLVVRLEESVIPFSALTVRPWKVESDVPKVTEEPEAVAFKVSEPNWSLSVEDTPLTVIFPLFPSPIVRLPAVIFASSVVDKLMSPVVPNPIVFADLEFRIVVLVVPLLKVPLRARSPAVMDRALFPVLNASPEARVKVPVPSLSVSASKVVVPADVKSSLMLMPLVALRVTAPAADMPTVVAFNVREPAETVPAEMVLLLMVNPLVPDNVMAPCPVMVPPF